MCRPTDGHVSCDAAILDFQILPAVSSRIGCGLSRAALAMKPQVDLALRRMAVTGVPKESYPKQLCNKDRICTSKIF